MYRFISNINRVIRQQFQGNGWKCSTTKDDVGKSKSGLVLYVQPETNVILNTSYSSFDDDGYGARQGPERDKKWYEPRDDYWWCLHNNSSIQALGWGAAAVLGIHLKPLADLLYHDTRDRPIVCPSVLLALGAPQPQQTQTGTSDSTNTPQSEIENLRERLAKVYEEYRATRENAAAAKYYSNGDYTNAVQHWKRACFLGSGAAQYNLGLCYQQGLGVAENIHKAVKFYEMAAGNDHPQAMYNLAGLYLDGHGGASEAMTLMERAADCGVTDAQLYVGMYYTDPQHRDMPRAVACFTQAAAQNDHDAQYMLGVCCERGWGIAQNECKAVDLYNRASIAGHAASAHNLGVMHELGVGGLPENRGAARDLYSKALSRGCEAAREALDRLDTEDKSRHKQHETQPLHDTSRRTNLPSFGSSPSFSNHDNDLFRKFSNILMDNIRNTMQWVGNFGYSTQTNEPRAKFVIGHPEEDNDNIRSLDENPSGQMKLTKTASVGCLADCEVVQW